MVRQRTATAQRPQLMDSVSAAAASCGPAGGAGGDADENGGFYHRLRLFHKCRCATSAAWGPCTAAVRAPSFRDSGMAMHGRARMHPTCHAASSSSSASRLGFDPARVAPQLPRLRHPHAGAPTCASLGASTGARLCLVCVWVRETGQCVSCVCRGCVSLVVAPLP